MISGLRALFAAASPPSRFTTAAVAIVVCGHRQLARTPESANSAAKPSVSSVMPYLESMYGGNLPIQAGSRLIGGDSVRICASVDFSRCGRQALLSR